MAIKQMKEKEEQRNEQIKLLEKIVFNKSDEEVAPGEGAEGG